MSKENRREDGDMTEHLITKGLAGGSETVAFTLHKVLLHGFLQSSDMLLTYIFY